MKKAENNLKGTKQVVNDFNTAILFLVFNRPNTTQKVFNVIRQIKPSRLYVAADGPRQLKKGEANLVSKVREIATKVDWPCELKTLFREKNIGCKHAVSNAISWFFKCEEQGIILEDDCLPHLDFFPFCENLLQKYAKDMRVSMITGDNFQNGIQRGDGSYYFSRYSHIWGWASWRRAWKNYDVNMSYWPNWKNSEEWLNQFSNNEERRYWEKIFDKTYNNQIDTWDYQWMASSWFHGGLTATPNVNLISNIGFGVDSTHTSFKNSPLANLSTESLRELIHPMNISRDKGADRYNYDNTFGGKYRRFPYNLIRPFFYFFRRIFSVIELFKK